MGLSIGTTSAAATVEQAKAHLRIDSDADDTKLAALLDAATHFVESATRRVLTTADCVLTLDRFPAAREIRLPLPPLRSVESVQHVDQAGATGTLAASAYVVDTISKPGRIALKPDESWPATAPQANAVTINFTAGFGDQAPELLRQCVLLLVGHWYENREGAIDRRIDEVPLAVRSIIEQFAMPEAA